MTEITCMNAATCARLHRLGANACTRCADKASVDGVDSAAGPVGSAAADENVTTADDHGNEGRHLYRVRLTKTEYYTAYVEIAADNTDDAVERASECEDVDWEYDDGEWNSPTIDEQLS